jgi:hypothetical protein
MLVITTNAGLWRYKIGDVVRFTSLSPYRIQITGRTKHYINTFGEELMVENADRAIEIVAKEMEVEVVDYTAAPIFMGEEQGSHEWMIEFNQPRQDIQRFNSCFDDECQLNSDYEAKRYKDLTMLSPVVNIARKGLFYEWLETKNKLGGQHKVPRLSNERDFLEKLLEMNA